MSNQRIVTSRCSLTLVMAKSRVRSLKRRVVGHRGRLAAGIGLQPRPQWLIHCALQGGSKSYIIAMPTMFRRASP